MLHKKSQYSSFLYLKENSKREFLNYTPKINKRNLNPIQKIGYHKKGKTMELNFHRNYITNKYEKSKIQKSISLSEKTQNSERIKSIFPSFTQRNLNSDIYSPLSSKNSFLEQRAFSFNSLEKTNLKKCLEKNNSFRKVLSSKSRNQFKNVPHYNSYNNTKYNRSLLDFKNVSKQMRLEKIKLQLKKTEVDKYKELLLNKLDFLKLKEHNYKSIINVFGTFQKDNNKYNQNINYQIKIEKEERDILLEKISQLRTDIFYLKHRLGKIKNFVEQSLDNKLFLLCVKNHTNQLDNFSINDKELYDKDKLLLDSLDSAITPKKLDKKTIKRKSQSLLITSLDNDVFDEENFVDKIIKQEPIFESIQLFEKHLDIIFTDIKNYLFEYNELQEEIILLREELLQRKKEEIIQEENNKKYNVDISHLKSKLKEKIVENKDLLNIKKNMKYVGMELSKKVKQKILDIYNYINENTNLIPDNNNSNEESDSMKKLRNIEFVFIYLLSIIQKLKKEKKQEYYIIKKVIDERNRIRNNEIQKETVKKEFEEKVKKVLLKNKKLIYKPLRKVAEDYKFK